MKLVLCAGTRQLEGYAHHDVVAYPGIDFVCDLWDIGKFVKDNTCERIEFTHALEHFPTREIIGILVMVRKLLVPGGELYLEVPNLAWHARLILNEGRDKDAVYYAFGGQEDEWDFHKTGFTPRLLQFDLEEAGFQDVKVLDDTSLIATAKK
jgi:predicted SAM-dependent methyltransferase